MFICDKCAARATVYRERALTSLPYARRALDEIRRRLRQLPPSAVFYTADQGARDITNCSLSLEDLSRIMALGDAIASRPSSDREGYWLSVRGTVEQRGQPHQFVLLLHYPWPPPTAANRWPLVLTRVIELGFWHSPEGYPLCWCSHTKEASDAL